jgi:hypothetical protein
MLFKGLILLSAAGVKVREGKHAAAVRHAGRAAALLRRLMKAPDRAFEGALGMSPVALAEYAEAAARIPAGFTGYGSRTASPSVRFRSRIKYPWKAERIARENPSSVGSLRSRQTFPGTSPLALSRRQQAGAPSACSGSQR